MLVLVGVLVFLDRQGRTNGQWPAPAEPSPRSGLINVIAVLAVVAAVVVGVQVYRVGDSGGPSCLGRRGQLRAREPVIWSDLLASGRKR